MITKSKLWNRIVQEMKTRHRLEHLTLAVMKKIEELDSNNAKDTNK